MNKNPLQRLQDFGQSVWNDNLSRNLIVSGELQNLIDNFGVVGVTSNPTIFDTAISKSSDYDDMIRKLVSDGRTSEEIYEALVVRDIQMACDILRPVYEKSNHLDGFVSLEVSPHLAHDTEGTITDARKLWILVDRPNLMIKIPGTDEGVPAIEQMLFEGVNINITLLFSLEAYRKVAEAYINALERRAALGKPLDNVHSVASFFVSRVDSEVDKRLEEIASSNGDSDAAILAKSLPGKVAVANAVLAYQVFRELFHSDQFSELAGRGARYQRPLWASTSTKNPDYPDTLYVDTLIGPNTVQTLAPASIEAFAERGTVKPTLESDVEGAHDIMAALEEAGIAYEEVNDILVKQGVESFAASFDSLMSGLEEKRDKLAGEINSERDEQIGDFASHVNETTRKLESESFARRLSHLDGSIWTDDPKVKSSIQQRLGWIPSVAAMMEQANAGFFRSFSQAVFDRGYRHVVLLGMGGSSLAPEVLATLYGPQEGYPELTVLDSTHPDSILRVSEKIGDDRTLFIVSSKSGGTIETRTLFHHFLDAAGGIASDFVVITDPGSQLETEARSLGCWRVFTNRPDIGGRYSALSYFGLIPAAAAGIDVSPILRRALGLLPIHDSYHPGIWLGTAIAEGHRQGRDKLTLVASGAWQAFGDWLEQLVAESTGKESTGILPVARESLRNPEDYASDRFFVELRSPTEASPALAGSLRDQGHPVIELEVEGSVDIGAEFLRWEIATAVAGMHLGINPFDEPNVQEAKDATNAVLESADGGELSTVSPDSAVEQIRSWASEGDYIAILAFVDRSDSNEAALENLRDALGAQTGLATTLGYGPRYLHSTGQLHKGGPDNGIFLQIVERPVVNLAIPGEEFSFGDLFNAQAIGDAQALAGHESRVVTIDAGRDLHDVVAKLIAAAEGSAVAAE